MRARALTARRRQEYDREAVPRPAGSLGRMEPFLYAGTAAVVLVLVGIAARLWLATREVRGVHGAIVAHREALDAARAARDAAVADGDAQGASDAGDRVQAARRAVNDAVREGEALRKRFPTSLYASRLPEPRYEEAEGGTAEPPRIVF